MNLIRWAAVAVTALFVAMNLGAALDPASTFALRVVGAMLAAAGAAGVVGLATNRPWGRAAVIAVGALNTLGAVAALLIGQDGFVVGIVVGVLGMVLGVLSGGIRRPVPAGS